ncbi:hCG21625 [Homo sapiens]
MSSVPRTLPLLTLQMDLLPPNPAPSLPPPSLPTGHLGRVKMAIRTGAAIFTQ